MDLYIITHEQVVENMSNYTIIGAYDNIVIANKAFNLYVNATEIDVRKEVSGVFNRFSEPIDEILATAICETPEITHRISLVKTELEKGT